MTESISEEDLSLDYFYKKKVIVYQERKGYRFSVDSPILADFLDKSEEHGLEIGTGSGIVSLLALHKNKLKKIIGIEIQKKLYEIAVLNSKKNGFEKRFEIINQDFNETYNDFKGIKYVFSNPPFLKTNSGRLSVNEEVRIAKFEIKLNLEQLMFNVFKVLADKGNFYMILPFERYDEVFKLILRFGYFVSKIRFVYSYKGGIAERFLIKLTNNKVRVNELPPLIIFKDKGVYSDEMNKILTGY